MLTPNKNEIYVKIKMCVFLDMLLCSNARKKITTHISTFVPQKPWHHKNEFKKAQSPTPRGLRHSGA